MIDKFDVSINKLIDVSEVVDVGVPFEHMA